MDYDKSVFGTSLEIIYKKEVIKTALNAMDNVSVMYGGADAAVHFGEKVPLKTVYRHGVTYAPISFFDKGINISPTVIGNEKYYPALEAYREAGYDAFSDGRLIVAGKNGSENIFKRKGKTGVNEYAEIAAYSVNHKEEKYSKEDCNQFIRNWKRYLIGDEKRNDLSDKDVAAAVKEIEKKALEARSLIRKDGNGQILFEGDCILNKIDNSVAVYYNRTLDIAKAYATYGSSYYGNKDFLDDVLYCLDWMYENKYGRKHITDDMWNFISEKGWYVYVISGPTALINTLMIVDEHLTTEQKCEYLIFFDNIREKPYGVGYNRLDNGRLMVASAILKRDCVGAFSMQHEIEETFLFVDNNRERSIETFLDPERRKYTVTKGQGFYTDGSYVYHTLLALNGMYGISHFEKAVSYLCLVQNTPFEITNPQVNNLQFWLYNNFEPLIYQCAMARTVQGRTNFPDCYDIGRRVVTAALEALDFINEEDALKFRQIIRHSLLSAPNVAEYIFKFLKIPYIGRLKEIMADDTLTPPDNSKTSKVFYHMDKAAHKREDWAMFISMSSARIFDFDSICHDGGLRNWYMGDGMTEYHIKGQYQNGSVDYWNYVNHYKLPGTTVDTQERKVYSIAQGNEYLSSRHFVGGVSLNGIYGVSAMDLEAYHFDEDFGIKYPDMNGGLAPKHKCDLTAKKAWFMFDDEVVCLGTDINARANNNAEVITVVENYMLNGNEYTENKEENWAHLCNACGYYFPNGENILTRVYESEYCGWEAARERWKKEKNPRFLEMWLSHGINPECGKYEYVLLPAMSKEKTREYAKNPSVDILENNGSIQAVYNRDCNVTGVVFWEKSSFDFITAHNPMILMYSKGDLFKIAVSDPTHKLTEGKLTIKGEYGVVYADEAVKVAKTKEGVTKIDIDFTDSFGRTVELTLK